MSRVKTPALALSWGFSTLVTLAAAGCGGGASDSSFACLLGTGTSQQCIETTTNVAGTPNCGTGMRVDACSHATADGGCQHAFASSGASLSQTIWYYSGTAAGTSQEMSDCVDNGGTWIAPQTKRRKGRKPMSNEKRNLELMQTLDDSWNNQDWETFEKRHTHEVVVRWPAQPATNGITNHRAEAIQMFKTFPDNHVGNRPYKTLFASGDWTCSIARFTGTMKGPMAGPDGKETPPTGKSFEVDFCTVARWDESGQIVEENLFYDVIGMMKQIGLG